MPFAPSTGRSTSVAVVFGAFLSFWLGLCAPAAGQDTAGLWVTQQSLTSRTAIERLVDDASRAGFTILLVEVSDLPLEPAAAARARGRRDRGPSAGVDDRRRRRDGRGDNRLQLLLTAARRRGLRVHAWIQVMRATRAGPLPTSRGHVVNRHPGWIMVPRDLAGRLARLDVQDPAYLAAIHRWTQPSPDGVDGLYLSPILPEVAEHIGERLAQLLARYRFDGVHLDSTQFPSSDFDYGRAAVAAFRAEIADGLTVAARRELDAQSAVDPLTYPDAFPRQWTRFRRSKMTALVARLGTIARRSRTGTRLSVSVVADQDEALGRRLQDWRTWADNGFVDILCLQPGSETAEEFELQVRAARQFTSRVELWVGLGAEWLSPFDTFDRIRASQRIDVDGIVVWRYDSVTDRTRQPPDHLRHIGLAIAAVPPR
ncbi:MAG: family 10 glycosylhydrolase [bacterium]